jgi:hypothetical protein
MRALRFEYKPMTRPLKKGRFLLAYVSDKIEI